MAVGVESLRHARVLCAIRSLTELVSTLTRVELRCAIEAATTSTVFDLVHVDGNGKAHLEGHKGLPNGPHSVADQFTYTYIQYEPLNTNNSTKTPPNHTKQDATDSRALDLERIHCRIPYSPTGTLLRRVPCEATRSVNKRLREGTQAPVMVSKPEHLAQMASTRGGISQDTNSAPSG